MPRYLTELIGTFFLVLTIGLSVTTGLALAPLAIGTVLTALVYMGGPVSGAHYNPAISLALLMRGAFSPKDFIPYLVSQLAGALAASLTVFATTGATFAPAPGARATAFGALLMETLFTFLLALVVLNVATSRRTRGNSYYGVAIGFTVMAGAFVADRISGAAFNPAVGIGPTVVNALIGGGGWSALWLYVVGPLAGGVLAVAAFRLQED